MVRHHDESSAGSEHVGALGEEGGEGLHLLVHLDAEGLEHLGEHFVLLAAGQAAGEGLFELGGGLDGFALSCHDDVGGEAVGVLHLAVEAEDAGQLGLVVSVDDGGGVGGVALAHPHVESPLEAGGEAFLGGVELVRRHSEVGDDAVDFVVMVELDEVFEVAEVLRDEGEPLVVDDVVGGVLVLVEGVQMAGGEPLHDGAGMSAAAEGDVGIDSLGTEVQSLKAFSHHDRGVIHNQFAVYS